MLCTRYTRVLHTRSHTPYVLATALTRAQATKTTTTAEKHNNNVNVNTATAAPHHYGIGNDGTRGLPLLVEGEEDLTAAIIVSAKDDG